MMADNEKEILENLRKLPQAAREQITRMAQGAALAVDALRESGLLGGPEDEPTAPESGAADPEPAAVQAVTC